MAHVVSVSTRPWWIRTLAHYDILISCSFSQAVFIFIHFRLLFPIPRLGQFYLLVTIVGVSLNLQILVGYIKRFVIAEKIT
jgi:hypothetical protein